MSTFRQYTNHQSGTYLRQNALIIILAQMGSFVPAEKAEFMVVDKIFSRVGASDNLANDQSTFMVEMVETANILNQATNKSFVIMDELGRGTSVLEGLSIATAVVQHLHNKIQCRTLFATHFHELIEKAKELKSMKPYKLEVKVNSRNEIEFTYRIVPDKIVDGQSAASTHSSYAIQVAKLAGVPQVVTDEAEKILNKLRAERSTK